MSTPLERRPVESLSRSQYWLPWSYRGLWDWTLTKIGISLSVCRRPYKYLFIYVCRFRLIISLTSLPTRVRFFFYFVTISQSPCVMSDSETTYNWTGTNFTFSSFVWLLCLTWSMSHSTTKSPLSPWFLTRPMLWPRFITSTHEREATLRTVVLFLLSEYLCVTQEGQRDPSLTKFHPGV